MENSKPKVAVYFRVASARQLDADNGHHGNSLVRPAFTKMNADIKAEIIGTVNVRRIDRITRDNILAGKWINGLDKRGAKLIAADGSHELSMFTSGICRELTRIKRRSRRGKQRRNKGYTK